MKIYAVSIILFFGIALSTCTYDLSTPEVCFQENVLPIFISKCSMAGCHDASGGEAFDLTTYDAIMKGGITPKHPLLSEIYTQISGRNPNMPKGNKLSAKDINYIKVWIKMGAKNTSDCSICDSTNVSYNGRIQPLLNTWCVGCHSGTSSVGKSDLSTYSGTLAIVNSNNGGMPATDISNRLLGALEHSTGYRPMPESSQISACDLNAIKKWIAAGKLNN